MRLEELLAGAEYTVIAGDVGVDIKGVAYDSRKVQPGDLFVCVSGFKTDGHQYIEEALTAGAIALLAERDVPIIAPVTVVHTANSRYVLPIIADNFYHQPSRELQVVGVTGTNGKTTTTHLIKSILDEARLSASIMGTLYARVGDESKELGHTTPEALEIQEFLEMTREKGLPYAVMEVSSHALDLGRVERVRFTAVVFTNFTQDHLDYHLNMEHYLQAKQKLFRMLPGDGSGLAVINADDPHARAFQEVSRGRVLTYAIDNPAQVKASKVDISIKGTRFVVEYDGGTLNMAMKLIGRFSVYNALAAITFALGQGIKPQIIKKGLERVTGVAGRFEQVDAGQNFTVVVDYAHTPDGLENILRTAREIAENRLITVFGCGGDRDRGKRPQMGEIAARYSDFCVVTSDNPRSEDPGDIIAEIVPGLEKVEGSRYAIISDRREAIHHAIYLARPGDLVVIAGKGHETYQLVKNQILDFDDRRVAREFLKELVR